MRTAQVIAPNPDRVGTADYEPCRTTDGVSSKSVR
jgi:hypothetical protein